jgi:hypothetical protein
MTDMRFVHNIDLFVVNPFRLIDNSIWLNSIGSEFDYGSNLHNYTGENECTNDNALHC